MAIHAQFDIFFASTEKLLFIFQ